MRPSVSQSTWRLRPFTRLCASRLQQLPSGAVAAVSARGRLEQVAHRVGGAQLLQPVGKECGRQVAHRVVLIARGAQGAVVDAAQPLVLLLGVGAHPLGAAAASGADALLDGVAQRVAPPARAQPPAVVAVQLQPLRIMGKAD